MSGLIFIDDKYEAIRIITEAHERDKQQTQQKRKEHKAEYMKNYMKEYIKAKSDVIQCECGSSIKAYNLNHKATKRHQNYLKMKELQDKITELEGGKV